MHHGKAPVIPCAISTSIEQQLRSSTQTSDTVLQQLHPDVLVLSECAAESTLAGKSGPVPWSSMASAGKVPEPPKNPDKGLAVGAFGDHRIQASPPVEPMMQSVARAASPGIATALRAH